MREARPRSLEAPIERRQRSFRHDDFWANNSRSQESALRDQRSPKRRKSHALCLLRRRLEPSPGANFAPAQAPVVDVSMKYLRSRLSRLNELHVDRLRSAKLPCGLLELGNVF